MEGGESATDRVTSELRSLECRIASRRPRGHDMASDLGGWRRSAAAVGSRMSPNSKPQAILPCLQNTTCPPALRPARGSAAQLVDDAPGVDRRFADLGIIEFGHAPVDARGVGKRCGALEDVAHDGLGIVGRVFGDVVVDRLEVSAGALGPADHGYQASISSASSSLRIVRPASMSRSP